MARTAPGAPWPPSRARPAVRSGRQEGVGNPYGGTGAKAYAAGQVDRVARARGLSAAPVRKLVSDHTHSRVLGFLGEPYTTDCPGIAFYAQFPMVRSRVRAALGTPRTGIPARRWPDIWRFVDGPVVEVAQLLLQNAGYDLAADGVFGTDMNPMVADFQTRNGIPVTADATFDLATWEALAPTLGGDATGLPVTALQFMLGRKGYPDVLMTGAFDHATRKAVRDMQRLHGLVPDGRVDLSTWCAVVGGSVREAFRAHWR